MYARRVGDCPDTVFFGGEICRREAAADGQRLRRPADHQRSCRHSGQVKREAEGLSENGGYGRSDRVALVAHRTEDDAPRQRFACVSSISKHHDRHLGLAVPARGARRDPQRSVRRAGVAREHRIHAEPRGDPRSEGSSSCVPLWVSDQFALPLTGSLGHVPSRRGPDARRERSIGATVLRPVTIGCNMCRPDRFL